MPDQSPRPEPAAGPRPAGVDPRSLRFGAAVSATLLVAVLLLAPEASARVVMAVVVALFAIGAAVGARDSVQGLVFRSLIAPHLAPPAELDDPRPPRFAQLVGFVVTASGLALDLVGASHALVVSAGLVLVVAFLNAAFGYSLGGDVYRWLRRSESGRGGDS